MGYFSNGTEGMMYEEEFCDRCVHQEDCHIWSTHMDWNYEQGKDEKKRAILDFLIPRAADGLSNEACTMFYARELAVDDSKCSRCGTTEIAAIHKPYCTAK